MFRFNLSIVVPIYNEILNIDELLKQLEEVVEKFSAYEIIFVDDGSIDGSFQRLKQRACVNKNLKIIKFTRNYGHQNALLAGISKCNGDIVVTMDGDLQHPPKEIIQMAKVFQERRPEVISLQRDAKKDKRGFCKKVASKTFYKWMNMAAESKFTDSCGDFRMYSRSAIEKILSLNEKDIFLRGVIGWMGLCEEVIVYQEQDRLYGTTKFTLRKMLYLAQASTIKYSTKPLELMWGFGLIVFAFSVGYTIYILYCYLIGHVVSGWSSLQIMMLFFGSIQFLFIGIVGEYVARVLEEVRGRPSYVVAEMVNM